MVEAKFTFKVGAILLSYLVSFLPAFIVRAYDLDGVSSKYIIAF